MTVWELMHRIDSRELTEWMAYDILHPLGAERLENAIGIVAHTVYTMLKAEGNDLTVSDFVVQHGKREEEQDVEAAARRMAAEFGGDVDGFDWETHDQDHRAV